MLRRDAEWLYAWGQEWTLDESHRHVVSPGTTVIVMGTYPFGAPAPWLAIDAPQEVVLPATVSDVAHVQG
jgi:hypothetical protein